MVPTIWDGLRCCRGPSTAARKRRGPPIGMTEFGKCDDEEGGVKPSLHAKVEARTLSRNFPLLNPVSRG